MDPHELAPLLAACRAGDDPAWEVFVRRFQGRIFALAYTYAGNREDARDLAQEIFVRLFEIRAEWVAAEEFMPWVIRVARNRSIDYLRRRAVRRPAATAPAEEVEMLADHGPSPEGAAVSHAQRDLVRFALRTLTRISRDVLVLREVQGLSIAEVASILGVPVGTVKSRASRARTELAERVLALGRGRSGG